MKLVIASLALLVLPAPTFAAVGGRCSGTWRQPGCICIDTNICRTRYGGTTIPGSPGNWACPNDPNNIQGCNILPCPRVNIGTLTQCFWRESCGRGRVLSGRLFYHICSVFLSCSTLISMVTDPVCPGGNDFVCCNLGPLKE